MNNLRQFPGLQRLRLLPVGKGHELYAVKPFREQELIQFLVGMQVHLLLVFLHLVQRWLRYIYVAVIYKRRHLPIEERKKQRADMRAVNVGIRHDDDLVIARLLKVELFLADPGSDGRYHGADFLVCKYLCKARFLNVKNLTLKRQNSLKRPIPPLFRAIVNKYTAGKRKIMGVRHFNIINIPQFFDFFYADNLMIVIGNSLDKCVLIICKESFNKRGKRKNIIVSSGQLPPFVFISFRNILALVKNISRKR